MTASKLEIQYPLLSSRRQGALPLGGGLFQLAVPARRPGHLAALLAAFVFTFLALIGMPTAASSQVLYGSLVGNVTDATGAAVVGAQVDGLNTDTGIVTKATTDQSGIFRLPNLNPGKYSVSIAANGFRKAIAEGIDVRTNTEQRVDMKLETGTVSQSVTVTGAPPELQTDNASVASELTSSQLDNLDATPGATNARNVQSLYMILPGFAPPAGAHSEASNPGDTLVSNVNGVSYTNNNTRIDGVSDLYPSIPETAAYVPSIEAIATVNAVTNNFDADQGIAAGAVINITTKGGTNRYHGTAWEYNLISALEAKPYFTPTTSRIPKYVLNQFGANYGGPILKNRAFFFANWERTRRAQAFSGFDSLPTPSIAAGNFQGTGTTIYDPATGNPDGTGRTPFLNNIIPTNRFSYAAQQIITLLPTPNVSTTALANNNFVGVDGEYTRDNIDTRVDWTPTGKSTVFGRYGVQKSILFDPQPFGKLGGYPVDGGQPGNANDLVQSVGLGGTYAFRPNLLVDGNFGFLRQGLTAQNTDAGTNYGLTFLNIPGTNGTSTFAGGFPSFTFGSTLSQLGNPNPSSPAQFRDNVFSTAENLTWNKGRHSTRYGFEFQHFALNHRQANGTVGPRGGFTFSGGVTALNGGAAANGYNAWADLLLGLPQKIQKDTQFLSPATVRENVWTFYASDKWQLTDKLTATYGVRYEYYPMATRDKTGLDIFNPNDGIVYVGGVNGIPENAGVDVGKGNFVPRVGLAYRINAKTVFRAGFGISVNPDNFRYEQNSYPTQLSQTIQGNTAFIAAGSLATGIPQVATPDLSTGKVKLPSNVSTFTLPLVYRRGYFESYNAAFERELPASLNFQATYVGTHIVREVPGININAAPPNGGVAGEPLNQALGISASITSGAPIGSGHYNGLQTQLTRHFARNGLAAVHYTYSRSTNDYGDNTEGSSSLLVASLPYYYRNRAVAGFDRPHNIQIFGNYMLPIGKGQTFLHNGFAGYILGGWGLGGVLSRLSGTPFTVTGSASSLNAPGNTQFADQLVPKVQILGGHDSTHPYFNTADFADPSVAEKATGTLPRFGTASRNGVRGPGFFNLSASVFREFPISERFSTIFRAEAFNLTNTPSFANPAANASTVTATSLGGFGIISATANNARELRFSARINF